MEVKTELKCARCHKPVSDPKSIKRGLGPKCYAKTYHGLSKPAKIESLPAPTQKKKGFMVNYLEQMLADHDVDADAGSESIRLSAEQTEVFFHRLQITQCKSAGCSHIFCPEDLYAYPHEGGWTVPGYPTRQWLFMLCPDCKVQWSLWKLGVERT